MEQGTEDWHTARLGKVTASRLSAVLAKGKSGGTSATRRNYMAELIAERLTGDHSEGFSSASIQWGKDNEPLAREQYELLKNATVVQTGFQPHPTLKDTGASPDGLIGDDGMVEIKCPNTATHIDRIAGASIKREYRLQMQWQMECTGRKWCDFVSFDPRMPMHLQLHVERVERDEGAIQEIKEAVAQFLGDMTDLMRAIDPEIETTEAA